LHSATYTSETAPGSTLNIKLKLNNVGYASLYNPRKVEFILKNVETAQVYVADTNEEPRFWSPLMLTEVTLGLGG
jgi:uncharacterized membrane protein